MIKSPSRFFLQATWICHANFLCFHEILKFLLILSLEDLEPHLSVMARNIFPAAAAAKSLQSCPTLCDPIDRSPPGSSIPGILQARILEWVAISFSNAWKWKVKVKSLSPARLFATPWTAAYQAPLSMGFSRQEYWSGAPLPSPNVFPEWHKNPPFVESMSGPWVCHYTFWVFFQFYPFLPTTMATTHLPLEAFLKLPK